MGIILAYTDCSYFPRPLINILKEKVMNCLKVGKIKSTGDRILQKNQRSCSRQLALYLGQFSGGGNAVQVFRTPEGSA